MIPSMPISPCMQTMIFTIMVLILIIYTMQIDANIIQGTDYLSRKIQSRSTSKTAFTTEGLYGDDGTSLSKSSVYKESLGCLWPEYMT